MREYRVRSGQPINPGNFYRECNKLVAQGLIAPYANPPEADPRRIPYCITATGCRDFDEWLLEPKPPEAALDSWLIFADMLEPADRLRLLDKMREELWMDSKVLAGARERVISRSRRLPVPTFNPAALLMLRRMKQITADLEFLKELRLELEQVAPGEVVVSAVEPLPGVVKDAAAPAVSARRKL